MSCACLSDCGCCTGVRRWTPEPVANRPGLKALAWRVGTQGTFLETMLARLSSADFPGLAGLRTRERSDFSIALCDAWATLADVLAFYDERLANEGFLRTASERRSVLELARLVGYRVRPGVAASVYLAFELEKSSAPPALRSAATPSSDDGVLTLPVGTAAQSTPGPGELPQSFETSEPLAARAAWNALEIRRSRPQTVTFDGALAIGGLWLAGTASGLKAGDALLLDFGKDADGQGKYVVREVSKIEPDNDAGRTRVRLRPVPQAMLELFPKLRAALATLAQPHTPPLPLPQVTTARATLTALVAHVRLALPFGAFAAEAVAAGNVLGELGEVTDVLGALPAELQAFAPVARPAAPAPVLTTLGTLLAPLLSAPALRPANALRLRRDLGEALRPASAVLPQLLLRFHPRLRPTLYASYAAATVATDPSPLLAVYALRVRAPLFGYNAPPQVTVTGGTTTFGEWAPAPDEDIAAGNNRKVFLDAAYDGLEAGGFAVVQTSGAGRRVVGVTSVSVRPRSAYNVSAKTTELAFDAPTGIEFPSVGGEFPVRTIAPLRSSSVLAQSEVLALAEEPLTADVKGDTLELARLYDGLEAGRWLTVSGPRADVPGTAGATGAELVMIAGVTHAADTTLPGDKPHTTLTLAQGGLAYAYRRDALVLNANVVKATHGATQKETLGSGDGAQRFQRFALKQPPLTHVAAATAAGAATTLEVHVNDLVWRETGAIALEGPDSRRYETRLDDDGKTWVVFGDGRGGARLPTGLENVKAVYRSGIGRAGNVKAGAVSLLQSQPLGVKGVVNPLPASGGADAESRDDARKNAPLAVTALDRLVSVQDYADFARTFAGIAKASAQRLSDGRREVLHLTVAGAGDMEIDERSDLYRALRDALRRLGDPHTPVVLALREPMQLALSARVRLRPDYLWEKVAPRLRDALLEAFGFAARGLGQPVYLSEVQAVLHGVAGVDAVDVDELGALTADDVVKLLEAQDYTAPLLHAVAFEAPAALLLSKLPEPVVPVRLARRKQADDPEGAPPILPAQLAVLDPGVPDTLVLTEMPR